jgi:hypothetical protein
MNNRRPIRRGASEHLILGDSIIASSDITLIAGIVNGCFGSAQLCFRSFEAGAVVVMYSDGVLERQNRIEEFGLARLEESVNSASG